MAPFHIVRVEVLAMPVVSGVPPLAGAADALPVGLLAVLRAVFSAVL